MSDAWNTEYRKLVRATYGAMFALQVREHMREGRGAPTDAEFDDYAEEAMAVAIEAAKRGEQG